MKDIPPKLKSAILRGRCIAFVGAGFAMPVVPGWGELLRLIAKSLGQELIPASNASAFDLEAMGQALQDRAANAGRGAWAGLVREALEEAGREHPRAGLEVRCNRLQSIPFKAILTTNFDTSLSGSPTNRDTYWQVLRADQRPGWQLPDADLNDNWRRPPIIKLHGDVDGAEPGNLVFSRRDYRRLVYGDGHYANFVRAVFAGYTVLFLGVSFTDAYLNELRSEVLSMLHEPSREGDPWGYAIQIGKAPEIVEFFEQHESIVTLSAKDPAEFDEWLEVIANATSVEGRLKTLLHGRTVVWVDANPANNVRGRELFQKCGANVQLLESEEGLVDAHAEADLLLTQFGYDDAGRHRAIRVLEKVNRWKERPPVIVFAAASAPDDELGRQLVKTNRKECLRHGAFEYTTRWSELYRLVESLFDRAPGDLTS